MNHTLNRRKEQNETKEKRNSRGGLPLKSEKIKNEIYAFKIN